MNRQLHDRVCKPKFEVYITETHKVMPSGENLKTLRDTAKATQGCFLELDQWTSSERVWAAGPIPFFEWWDASDIGCAYEFFMDAMVIMDEEGTEATESMESLYFFKGQLYVKTDLDFYGIENWLSKQGEWGEELITKIKPK